MENEKKVELRCLQCNCTMYTGNIYLVNLYACGITCMCGGQVVKVI